MADETDYGSLVLSEASRRAWAVEQAIAWAATLRDGDPERDRSVTDRANELRHYLETPQREADERLLQAARGYDGTQDAGVLIGLLADTVERMVRGS